MSGKCEQVGGDEESEPENLDCCKVAQVAKKYDTESLLFRLPSMWLGEEGREEHSLRELERKFNVSLLRSALEDAGVRTVVGEADSRYEVLQKNRDEYTAGEIAEVEEDLKAKGVDIDEVKSDFVSHQSIANHLRGCREVKKDIGRSKKGRDRKNVKKLKEMVSNRLVSIIEKRRKRGEIDIPADYRLEQDFYVVSEDGKRERVEDLLD